VAHGVMSTRAGLDAPNDTHSRNTSPPQESTSSQPLGRDKAGIGAYFLRGAGMLIDAARGKTSEESGSTPGSLKEQGKTQFKKYRNKAIWMGAIGLTVIVALAVLWVALEESVKESVKRSIDLPYEKKKIDYEMQKRAQLAAMMQQQQNGATPSQ
jgi:hypothetical protein